MKHLIVALLTGVAACLAQAGVLVTDLKGKAETDGKRVLAMLSEIANGAQIELAPGAQLVVTDLVTGREYVLLGAGRFRVEKGGVQGLAGAGVMAKALPASNLPEVKVAVARVAQATLTMRGNAFSSAAPAPLVPARTAVMTGTPTLRWSAVEGAASYRVTVYDEAGKPVFESSTKETELALLSGAGLVSGKQYSWRVEALNAKGRIADASTIFTVLSPELARMLEQIRPDKDASYSRRVLYAAQLQEAGAVQEARTLWEALAKERPEDSNLAKLAR